MTPRVRRLVAVVTLILVLAVVAVLTLRAFGVPIAVGPDPTREASLEPTAAPSTTATPTLEEALAELQADMVDIRDLPPTDIGPVEFISREELEQRLAEAFAEDYTAEEIAADNALYHALGLLAPDQDIAELQLQLLSSQVIGFYDDEAQSMVVVADAGLTPETEVVYVHEYVHALQDAAFGMDSLPLDGGDDAAFAALSLLEGDATTAMVLWAYDNLSAQEILGISQTPLPDTTGVPAWMVTQLGFSYVEGTDFAAELYQRGGFAAVDEAWADPPRSTEQVLHMEAYLEDEEPVEVTASANVPPDELLSESTFGEAMIAIWLAGLGVEGTDADVAAAGWGGDTISVIASADRAEVGIALRIAFDTTVDADEFEEAYADAANRLDGYTELVRDSDTEVTILQGTTDQLFSGSGQTN